ncbi:hypothetical protein CLV59_11032 [Chitinophaga dinghuensis]|uniref:Uncharacterized protein n=1 Tax=Chitinophaga dinghuensis TaxID=1539050 RepID=A0A327VMI7_9BACT|nr:hypothetical protein [Chitinophaga dinghuensis]RAJ74986.1 hypothetical protein CLV59_11032 [Chitinophaga dinghuensis]
MMEIQISNGKGIIDIIFDGSVICLKIKRPVALDWDDLSGSIGRYYKCTPHSRSIPQQLTNNLIDGTNDEILNGLKDFLQLFRSGTYKISMNPNDGTFFPDQHPQGVYYNDLHLYNYYPYEDDHLMFTQDRETLDQERIHWYEQLISQGGRPKALVFKATQFDPDGPTGVRLFTDPMFVLDGHHKLTAYDRLGIAPELIIIDRKTNIKEEKELYEGKNLLAEYEYFLSPGQRNHIIYNAAWLGRL